MILKEYGRYGYARAYSAKNPFLIFILVPELLSVKKKAGLSPHFLSIYEAWCLLEHSGGHYDLVQLAGRAKSGRLNY